MKVISNTEAAQLKYKTLAGRTGSKATPIFEAMARLAVGEALVLPKEEWPNKSMPHYSSIPKRLKIPYARYSTRSLADDSAFVITRNA